MRVTMIPKLVIAVLLVLLCIGSGVSAAKTVVINGNRVSCDELLPLCQ